MKHTKSERVAELVAKLNHTRVVQGRPSAQVEGLEIVREAYTAFLRELSKYQGTSAEVHRGYWNLRIADPELSIGLMADHLCEVYEARGGFNFAGVCIQPPHVGRCQWMSRAKSVKLLDKWLAAHPCA